MSYLKTITFSLALLALGSAPGKSQCNVIADSDNFSSAAGWTTVDNTPNNGSVRISGGAISMSTFDALGPVCANSQGVHNNREVRVHRPLSLTLSNTQFRAECKANITGGNGPSQTLMGLTAGTAYPHGINNMNAWSCTNSNQVPINQYSIQDGIYVSLIAFGANQLPTANDDRLWPGAAVQTSVAATPANLGWRIYAHATNGNNTAFYPATVLSASNPVLPANNSSRGIALPTLGGNYWIRLERLSATNCALSVFSDAAMTTHVLGSPQCFTIDADIVGLNNFQNFGHMSGSYYRSITGTIDDFRVYNNCPGIPAMTVTPQNAATCAGGSVTLTATPGLSNYSWTDGTTTWATTTNTITVTPSANTTYTVTATYNGATCPVVLTATVAVSIVTPVLTPAISLPPYICSGNPISPVGSASGNVAVSNHFWEMIECDQYGVPKTSPVYSFSQWYPGAPGNYTFPNSSTVPCNKYYRVKLAVQNTPCVGWSEVAQVIYVACTPNPVISGPTTVCYGSPATLTVTGYPKLSTFVWTSVPAYSGPTVTTNPATFTPTVTTTYSVTVTSPYGCVGSATFTVTPDINNPAFNLGTNLNANDPFYTCAATPVVTNANANPNFGYAWVVEELDASNNVVANTTVSNPACWWGYGLGTCLFTGYNGTSTLGACNLPVSGHFTAGHKYRITRGTWITGVCPWQQYSVIVYESHSSNGQPVIIVEEDLFAPDYSAAMQQGTNEMPAGELLVTPNPSGGRLNLASNNTAAGVYTVRIFNAVGSEVYNETTTHADGSAFRKEIDLTGMQLPEGVYLVKLQTPGMSITKRVLLVK